MTWCIKVVSILSAIVSRIYKAHSHLSHTQMFTIADKRISNYFAYHSIRHPSNKPEGNVIYSCENVLVENLSDIPKGTKLDVRSDYTHMWHAAVCTYYLVLQLVYVFYCILFDHNNNETAYNYKVKVEWNYGAGGHWSTNLRRPKWPQLCWKICG